MSVFVQWYVQYYMYCKFTSFVTLKNFTELLQLIEKTFQRSTLIL